MEWQGYFYIENLGLNAQQKQALIAALQQWGLRNDSDNPKDRNHWRTRLDNEALIFEAAFNAEQLTLSSFEARLVGLFGVSAEQIGAATSQNKYGEVAVFSYGGTDRLRLGVFAGRQAGYLQSQVATQQFLIDFASDWNGGIE